MKPVPADRLRGACPHLSCSKAASGAHQGLLSAPSWRTVTRIPSEAPGYCYSHRILYADREFWSANWVDLYDSNHKLWKSIAYLNQVGNVPGMGHQWKDIAESVAWHLQNVHATIWSSYGNPNRIGAYLDFNAPKEYLDGVKYGSPSGLMEILR